MPIKTHIYRQKIVSILLVLDQKKTSLKSDQLEILLGVLHVYLGGFNEYTQFVFRAKVILEHITLH